jgi:phage-related protein
MKRLRFLGNSRERCRRDSNIWEESGAYRVIYAARRAEAIYALHAFQKKTPGYCEA